MGWGGARELANGHDGETLAYQNAGTYLVGEEAKLLMRATLLFVCVLLMFEES